METKGDSLVISGMEEQTQQHLLERIRAGDKGALQDMFLEYYSYVCQRMLRLIKDQSLVEDLAQEVFLRFWQKRERIEVNTSLKAYLGRMAINEALQYLRSRKYYPEEVDEDRQNLGADRSAEDQFLDHELSDYIREAIDQLPPKCRLVFTLSRYEGMSYKEIAQHMDISSKTVENQMGKALKILREALKPYLQMGLLFLFFLF